MEYFYNYRVGLIVRKNNFIESITIDDLRDYHKSPFPSIKFTPIELTEKVILAYGFKKDVIRGNICIYRKSNIVLERKGKNEIFFCSNIRPCLTLKYLHELQDFYNINTYLFNPRTLAELMEFIYNYGSKRI